MGISIPHIYQVILLLGIVLSVTAYSKYGRTCKDIGCLPNEVCTLAFDTCSYVQREGKDCGSYPTCKRNTDAGGQHADQTSSAQNSHQSAPEPDISGIIPSNQGGQSNPSNNPIYPVLPSNPKAPSNPIPPYNSAGGHGGYNSINSGGYVPPYNGPYGNGGHSTGDTNYPQGSGGSGGSSYGGGGGSPYGGGGANKGGSSSSSGSGTSGSSGLGGLLSILGGSGVGSSGGLSSILSSFGQGGSSSSSGGSSGLSGILSSFGGSSGTSSSSGGLSSILNSFGGSGSGSHGSSSSGLSGILSSFGNTDTNRGGSSSTSSSGTSSILSGLSGLLSGGGGGLGNLLNTRQLIENRRYGGLFNENPSSSSSATSVNAAKENSVSRAYPTQAPNPYSNQQTVPRQDDSTDGKKPHYGWNV